MKLKIKEFEALAKQNGYRNGKALMKKKVIYQITRHKISKIEITSEEEERAVAEANQYISVGGTLY